MNLNAFMNEGIARYTSRFFSKPVDKRRQPIGQQDYKSKLWSTKEYGRQDVGTAAVPCPYAERVRRIVSSLHGSVACQSVAVAALQSLERVLQLERTAAKAAISLAQGEKLDQMVQTTESTLDAISQALNAQGSRIMNLSSDDGSHPSEETSWWFALSETLESIENGTQRILSLASAQPKGGAARQLSTIVVQLLRNKHRQLLSEADAWIS